MEVLVENESSRLKVISYINELDLSTSYYVKIDSKKKNRSNLQNSTMWLWFACLENELGQDKQEIYQYYCEKFIPECCTYFRDGRFDSGGTSKLKTDEMAHYLKKIQADAASEFGCQLPTREDMFFDDFRMKYERYTH